MTEPPQIQHSTLKRSFARIVREEFDAFERREYRLRMEERKERAAQFKLPIASIPQEAS